MENLNMNIAVNSTGRLGLIIGCSDIGFGECYIGFGLDGKGTWASTKPIVISNAVDFHNKLLDRFEGKLTKNG